VEEELLRCESREVRIADEATTLGPVVVLREVGQCAVAEAEGNAAALDVLLADAGNHLGDVDEGALGAARDHGLDVVAVLQGVGDALPGHVARLVQNLVDLGLEDLPDALARLRLQLPRLRLQHELLHLVLGLADGLVDLLHGLVVGDGVPNADSIATLQQPACNDLLHLAEEHLGDLVAVLVPDDVDERALRGTQSLLVHDAG
jgi:hypothetical protein